MYHSYLYTIYYRLYLSICNIYIYILHRYVPKNTKYFPWHIQDQLYISRRDLVISLVLNPPNNSHPSKHPGKWPKVCLVAICLGESPNLCQDFFRLTVGLNGCEGMFKADKFYTGKQPCGTESKTAQRAVLWYHINIHLLIDMYCKYLRVYIYILVCVWKRRAFKIWIYCIHIIIYIILIDSFLDMYFMSRIPSNYPIH